MDVIAHGFWGGISFGRRSRNLFLLAFLFGVLPDVIPFAYIFLTRFIPDGFRFVPVEEIPSYVYSLYNFTHSLIVALLFLLICLLVWRGRGWIVAAWPLHVIFDIFTHDLEFFPTPYLWPFATPLVAGVSWLNLEVLLANWILLLVLYFIFFLTKKRDDG